MTQTTLENAIVCTVVPENKRLDMLPKYFGTALMSVAEASIYGTMEKLCDQYTGGLWEYFELSNGGFYMAPKTDEKFTLSVSGNHFKGEMSADAAGIVVCIFVMNAFCWKYPSQDNNNLYYALRDYAIEHPEANLILSAID